jgi:hypothetical protein
MRTSCWPFLPALVPGSYHVAQTSGIVLYDSDHVEPNPSGRPSIITWHPDFQPHHVRQSAHGQRQRQKHFLAGLSPRCSIEHSKLEKPAQGKIRRQDPSILNNAMAAFHAGYGHSLGNVLETFNFVESQSKSSGRWS